MAFQFSDLKRESSSSPLPPAARESDAQISVPTIHIHSGLREVIECFETHPSMRLLPVVDDRGRPKGAIYEVEIRRLLFNPFGHALMSNPGVNGRIGRYLKPCPTIEVTAGIDVLVDQLASPDFREGVILTKNERFENIATNRALLQLAAERESKRAKLREERLVKIRTVSAAFQDQAARLTEQLAEASSELATLAADLSNRARDNDRRGADMASAAQSAAEGLISIASEGAQLTTAFERIREQSETAHGSVAEAVEASEAASERAQNLKTTTAEISGVVDLIQGISKKVHMLALNARIEAARAGSAGHAFSVVASEIRGLASQTSEATETIRAKMQSIHNAVGSALEGNEKMRSLISAVDRAAAEIDEAMEGHGAATRSIADHVSDATLQGRDIERSVLAVRDDARTVIQRSNRMQDMADGLSKNATIMRDRVQTFLANLEAA